MLIDRLLVGLLTGGHVLLEGVPGLAKTLAVRTLARGLRLSFSRIQFTPDLLPADVIGTQIYNPRTGDFSIKKGPVFANLVLADEINRAPPRCRAPCSKPCRRSRSPSATPASRLEQPFLVLATQNPIEQEGTYPLPEAQVDRFMLKLKITYPDKDEELTILDRMVAVEPRTLIEPVLGPDDLLELRAGHRPDLRGRQDQGLHRGPRPRHARPAEYGLDIGPYIQYPASPRATIFLTRRPRLRRSSKAAATSRRRTSRRSARTCCATASASPTRPRPRRSRRSSCCNASSTTSRCRENTGVRRRRPLR